MTELIFDVMPDNDEDLWTTARLTDELFLNLASVREKIYNSEGKAVTVHKYYHQARVKMRWIPMTKGKGSTVFTIHISDLTSRLRKELEDYYKETGKKSIAILLKQAICRIFENLSFEYTHTSIMKNLTVRLIK